MTAVHITAFLGSLAVLHELLTSSLNDEILLKALNQADQRHQTPLFYACAEGHLDLALALLRAGANAYHIDRDNQTCLHAMLSSSVILRRHIRLFYRFIQFVDFRSQRDQLGRSLLDLACENRWTTMIDLLTLLKYERTSDAAIPSTRSQLLSLRQLCLLKFKRSLIYHRHQRQAAQRDLLESALQQTFQIEPSSTQTVVRPPTNDHAALEPPAVDEAPLAHPSNKYLKNVKSIKHPEKKLRKTSSIFSSSTSTAASSSSSNKWSSQNDLQHTPSNWSVFTNKFKGQRLPPIAANSQHEPLPASHPMRALTSTLLAAPGKLDDLLDFPSLINNSLLIDDIQTSVHTYKLLRTDGPHRL